MEAGLCFNWSKRLYGLGRSILETWLHMINKHATCTNGLYNYIIMACLAMLADYQGFAWFVLHQLQAYCNVRRTLGNMLRRIWNGIPRWHVSVQGPINMDSASNECKLSLLFTCATAQQIQHKHVIIACDYDQRSILTSAPINVTTWEPVTLAELWHPVIPFRLSNASEVLCNRALTLLQQGDPHPTPTVARIGFG